MVRSRPWRRSLDYGPDHDAAGSDEAREPGEDRFAQTRSARRRAIRPVWRRRGPRRRARYLHGSLLRAALCRRVALLGDERISFRPRIQALRFVEHRSRRRWRSRPGERDFPTSDLELNNVSNALVILFRLPWVDCF